MRSRFGTETMKLDDQREGRLFRADFRGPILRTVPGTDSPGGVREGRPAHNTNHFLIVSMISSLITAQIISEVLRARGMLSSGVTGASAPPELHSKTM